MMFIKKEILACLPHLQYHCWNPKFSTEILSKVLVSRLYQCLSFALKSPIAASKYWPFSDNFSKVNSEFCENHKKSS